MKRANRLIELIQILRDGRFHRAEDIARRLNVSLRTIYRDMDTLALSGIPVAGARGLGFQITAPVTLPPLNLTMAELEALHLGMAVVGEAADDELSAAARSLSAKIDAVLPEDRSAPPKGWGFAVYPFADAAAGFQHMPAIRAATRARQKLSITYLALDGAETRRTIRPLALEYWGRVWTVTCWCEFSDAFQELRVDRIQTLKVLPALFVDEDGKTLADCNAQSG
jgi:predicted DNA-binding transcriptional regulator YafY